ncbi:MAG: PD-(D/E)XK nuclease family protein, partial [Candidatus Izemoplasmatales bacterium]
MKLAELDNNTLIFSEKQAKVNLLLGLKAKKQIKKLYFSNGLNLFKEVKYNYPFFMYNKFNIKVDLAKRILKFLPYINIKKNYQDKKLTELKDIKNELIKASIYYDFDYNKFTKVVCLDESIMPKFIKHYQKYNYFEKQAKSIKLIRSENQLEQVYAIYEKVVELLEESVAIDKIKIVNTLPEDNYQLQKIFTDANIPIYINKAISITKYPFYKSFKKLFKTETLAQVKTYLLKNQTKQKELTTKIINCFNRYSDKQIENNKDIFLYELEKETIKEEKYLNTVEIIDINDINVYSDNYYLFINYIDEIFPRKIIDNDYLTDKQKQLINFFTSEEINKYNLKYYSHLFNAIKNLVLFMPETVIDQTRKSRLNLDRGIVEKKYTYKLNTKSYLHGLNYLRYGKLRYNYLNYNLESSDYYLLKNTYKENFKTFNPQFKGIKTETLTKLLDNYSITGAKLEALNLCPFQYFLTYLLKLGLDIDNHYLYFGNVIHKALENLVINPDYDYKSLVKNSDNFPKDIIYKNEIYQEILIDIIEYIYSEVNKLHQVSDYKKILTEQKFNFKLDKNDRFSIKGIIDKVMLDTKEKYFAIIDYKFSDKSFSL